MAHIVSALFIYWVIAWFLLGTLWLIFGESVADYFIENFMSPTSIQSVFLIGVIVIVGGNVFLL